MQCKLIANKMVCIKRLWHCSNNVHHNHIYTVSQKKLCIFFCQNFVKFPRILINFGR